MAPKLNKKGTRRGRQIANQNRDYKHYIAKLLKNLNIDLEISSKGMNILNDILKNVVTRLTKCSDRVRKSSKRPKKTLQFSHVDAAIKLLFPGEIGKCAQTEIIKATVAYKNSFHVEENDNTEPIVSSTSQTLN